jgi:hypothetical protein
MRRKVIKNNNKEKIVKKQIIVKLIETCSNMCTTSICTYTVHTTHQRH